MHMFINAIESRRRFFDNTIQSIKVHSWFWGLITTASSTLKNKRFPTYWIPFIFPFFLLVHFDLTSNVIICDEWVYGWPVHYLAVKHILTFMPQQSAFAIPQILFSSLISFIHYDPILIRLSILPGVIAVCYFVSKLAISLGAKKNWAYMASFSVLANPIFLATAVGYESDTFFIAFLVASLYFGFQWIDNDRRQILFLFLIYLAFLQRQIGIFLLPAFFLGVLLSPLPREKKGKKLFILILSGLVTGATYLSLNLTHIAPAVAEARFNGITSVFWPKFYDFIPNLSAWICLTILPFVCALFFKKIDLQNKAWPRRVGLLISHLVILVSVIIFLKHGSLFVGDELSSLGLGPLQVDGYTEKPPLYGFASMAVLQFVSVLCFSYFLWKFREQLLAKLNYRYLIIIAFALPYAFFMAVIGPLDRYLIPVLVPLVSVFVVLASKTKKERLSLVFASVICLLGLGMFIVGEQDYLAWEVAVNTTAKFVYTKADPGEVSAGYEANGVYYEIPYLEKYKTQPPGYEDFRIQQQYNAVRYGPVHPLYCIRFASPTDTHPGVNYYSFAPGKIIFFPISETSFGSCH